MFAELLLGLLAWSGADAGEETLRVCARPNAGFLTVEGERPRGLEYDLLRSFAQSQDLELELVWLKRFADLLPAVEKGDCDVGAAGVMVTDERARRVSFSAPYFPALVTLVETGERYSAVDDLKGKQVAAVSGTLHEQILRKIEGVQVVAVDNDQDLFAALVAGDVDALVCDSAIVLPFLADNSDLHISLALSEPAHFAFPLPLGSQLKTPLDKHLRAMRDSGKYRRSLVRHFGKQGASFILEDEF